MSIHTVFVPGVFPSTNQVLALCRQEGVWFSRRGWTAAPPPEGYSWWARWTRQQGELHTRAARLPELGRVDVALWFVRHPRYDADAWTSAGKWLLDGVADAGVIRSDRRDVRTVQGRCFATYEEGESFLHGRGVPVPERPGVVIELAQVTS